MHIPDGFLSPEVAGATAAVSAVALGYGLRRGASSIDTRRAALAVAIGSAMFGAHMLEFPLASGSGHVLGVVLAAVLLGPRLAFFTIGGVLLLQAVVLADGGLAAFGANLLNIGVIGALVIGGLILAARRAMPLSRAAFLGLVAAGAWLAVMAGAAAISAQLAASGSAPLSAVVSSTLGGYAVIALVEAGATTLVLGAVLAWRRDLVAGFPRREDLVARRGDAEHELHRVERDLVHGRARPARQV